MTRTLIISGGPLDEKFGREYMQKFQWDRIIAADRGLAFCRKASVCPDLILGDFDSVDQEAYDYFAGRCPDRFLRFPAHKDETDTELALQNAIAGHTDEIHIIGALGGRVDHMLGNIQLLKMAEDAGQTCYLLDEKNRVRLIGHDMVLEKNSLYAPNVSLIPFTLQVTGLTLQGFEYEVRDFDLIAGKSRGLSNRVTADRAKISFRSGLLLVVESRD